MEIKKENSPNFSSREGSRVDMIVIHCASLPEGVYGTGYITDLFLNRLDISAHPSFCELEGLRVSAHYLIERTGEVIEFVDCDNKAWHAGKSSYKGRDDLNLNSIGIELEGDIHSEFTDEQYESLVTLMKTLIERYEHISKDNIVRHSEIAPGRKNDPGPYFYMDMVVSRVFS